MPRGLDPEAVDTTPVHYTGPDWSGLEMQSRKRVDECQLHHRHEW